MTNFFQSSAERRSMEISDFFGPYEILEGNLDFYSLDTTANSMNNNNDPLQQLQILLNLHKDQVASSEQYIKNISFPTIKNQENECYDCLYQPLNMLSKYRNQIKFSKKKREGIYQKITQNITNLKNKATVKHDIQNFKKLIELETNSFESNAQIAKKQESLLKKISSEIIKNQNKYGNSGEQQQNIQSKQFSFRNESQYQNQNQIQSSVQSIEDQVPTFTFHSQQVYIPFMDKIKIYPEYAVRIEIKSGYFNWALLNQKECIQVGKKQYKFNQAIYNKKLIIKMSKITDVKKLVSNQQFQNQIKILARLSIRFSNQKNRNISMIQILLGTNDGTKRLNQLRKIQQLCYQVGEKTIKLETAL